MTLDIRAGWQLRWAEAEEIHFNRQSSTTTESLSICKIFLFQRYFYQKIIHSWPRVTKCWLTARGRETHDQAQLYLPSLWVHFNLVGWWQGGWMQQCLIPSSSPAQTESKLDLVNLLKPNQGSKFFNKTLNLCGGGCRGGQDIVAENSSWRK